MVSKRLAKSRICRYRECGNHPVKGWTTCPKHKTAGISIRQWNKRQK